MTQRMPVDLLLVEDSGTYAYALKVLLESAPIYEYSVTHCPTISDAKRELSCHEFDVVLIDLKLPNGEGTSLIRQIRQLAPGDRTAIAILTGYGTEERELESRRALANDFIEKGSFTSEEFIVRIRNLAIWALGHKVAKGATSGLDRIGKKIDDTMEMCESTKSLPPYKG